MKPTYSLTTLLALVSQVQSQPVDKRQDFTKIQYPPGTGENLDSYPPGTGKYSLEL